jgi:hypothetical protein
VVFGWLFRKSLSRERAIALAVEHLTAHGCCVAASAPDADVYGDAIPYLFVSATKPGSRWYVEFERVLPKGAWHSRTNLTVYVWADTGLVTFDPFAGWEMTSSTDTTAAP